MATPYCECYRPDPVVWAPAGPFGSRAAPLAATAVRSIGPLFAAATALLELPWHTAGFSGAAPVVFFSAATVARAVARLRRLRGRVAGGSRRRVGAW